MAVPSRDQFRASAVGYQWASQIVSVALSMSLPACAGYLIDAWWGTSPWCLVLGSCLGLGVGIAQLIRLTAPVSRRGATDEKGVAAAVALPHETDGLRPLSAENDSDETLSPP